MRPLRSPLAAILLALAPGCGANDRAEAPGFGVSDGAEQDEDGEDDDAAPEDDDGDGDSSAGDDDADVDSGGDDGGSSGDDPDTGAGETGDPAPTDCATAPAATGDAMPYEMREPPGLDASKAVPLLIHWGGSLAYLGPPFNLEDQFGITDAAAERGYLLAYAQSPDNPNDTTPAMSTVRAIINDEGYCIDANRIFLSGHSQGGITAELLVGYNTEEPKIAAIAPSAGSAGLVLGPGDTCPAMMPISTFIMHASNDEQFGPQGGRGYRDYMVSCAGCSTTPEAGPAAGCEAYPGCDEPMDVVYCEHSNGHTHWPTEWLPAMFDFFDAHPRQ